MDLMTEISIQVGTGDIHLQGGMGVGDLTWDTKGSTVTNHRNRDGTLSISGNCKYYFGCKTSMSLDFLKNIPVTATLGSGDFYMDTLQRDLVVTSDKGDIIATNLSSPNVRVQTNWGNVRLTFASIPKRLEVSTVIGNIDVEVPYAVYIVTETPGHEEDVMGIPVYLHTTSGTVKMVKRPPPQ